MHHIAKMRVERDSKAILTQINNLAVTIGHLNSVEPEHVLNPKKSFFATTDKKQASIVVKYNHLTKKCEELHSLLFEGFKRHCRYVQVSDHEMLLFKFTNLEVAKYSGLALGKSVTKTELPALGVNREWFSATFDG